jgi:hypothetical protein
MPDKQMAVIRSRQGTADAFSPDPPSIVIRCPETAVNDVLDSGTVTCQVRRNGDTVQSCSAVADLAPSTVALRHGECTASA